MSGSLFSLFYEYTYIVIIKCKNLDLRVDCKVSVIKIWERTSIGNRPTVIFSTVRKLLICVELFMINRILISY